MLCLYLIRGQARRSSPCSRPRRGGWASIRQSSCPPIEERVAVDYIWTRPAADKTLRWDFALRFFICDSPRVDRATRQVGQLGQRENRGQEGPQHNYDRMLQ